MVLGVSIRHPNVAGVSRILSISFIRCLRPDLSHRWPHFLHIILRILCCPKGSFLQCTEAAAWGNRRWSLRINYREYCRYQDSQYTQPISRREIDLPGGGINRLRRFHKFKSALAGRFLVLAKRRSLRPPARWQSVVYHAQRRDPPLHSVGLPSPAFRLWF